MSQAGIIHINVAELGLVTTIDGDTGSATPSGGVITISGGTTGLTTSASGSTVTLGGTLNVASGGTGDTSFNPYALITGGTSATSPLQNVVGLGSAGQVLTSAGASALPAWSSVSASGAITTIDGDSGSMTPLSGVVTVSGGTTGLTTTASSHTLDLTGTLGVANGGTGVASQTAYSLVCGGTTSTGAFQAVADVATGSVLVSGGTSALPAFSTTPSVTSITLGGGSALGIYKSTTSWSPSLQGITTGGTTTYTTQLGEYIQIGNVVHAWGRLVITAATGTGNAVITNLPVTSGTYAGFNFQGVLTINGTGWPLPSNTTMSYCQVGSAVTQLSFFGIGNAVAQANVQMANAAATIVFAVTYSI